MGNDIDIWYWLQEGINRLFKEHPTCSFAILTGISGVVLGVMFLKAENLDDLVYPIFGVVFIFTILTSYIIRVKNR